MSPQVKSEHEHRADEITVLLFMAAVTVVAFVCLALHINLKGLLLLCL